jgi:pilus assembly protein CpaC
MPLAAKRLNKLHGAAKRQRSISVAVAAGILCMFLMATTAAAIEEVRVVVGKSKVLRYPEKIETVSLANEEIADVVAITADELVVIGKETGRTSLIVWGESMTHTQYEIIVDRTASGRQILLEVQIGEVNTTELDELGVDLSWVNTDNDVLAKGTKAFGSFTGEVGSPSVPLGLGQEATGFFKYIGDFDDISASVHALQQDGHIKILAEPKLLCLSGEEASFLSGGEFPIPVAVSGAGGVQQITIEWKEYGVKLDFVPTVIDTNLINLRVKPEVSNIDFTNSIVISGFMIPAFQVRRADAMVELNSGQALLLGGLKSSEEIKTIQRVPILGHIPLLGALFTRKDSSVRENELVIIISPRIIENVAGEPIPPLPYEGAKHEDSDSKTDPESAIPSNDSEN